MALKKEIIELASKIENAFSMKDGVVSVEGKPYEENLPENITMEVVESVGRYNSDFVSASSYAFGNMALAAMKEDSKLKELEVTIPMGWNDSVNHNIQREKVYNNALNPDAGDITKYGVMKTSYEVKNKSQLKQVQSFLKESAAEKLSK